MAGKDNDREQEEQPRVIISDKRHSRDDEGDSGEAEAQQPTQHEPELEVVEPDKHEQAEAAAEDPPATPAAEKSDEPDPARQEPEPAPQEPADQPPAAAAPEEGAPQSAEMEQLKMIFDAGISSYLAGQVSMFINFALIYLGRAANPATGIVATDTKKAKIAIDTLEFVSAQIKDELPEAEQKQLAGIVADLKYTFMQAATGGPAGTPGTPGTPPGNGT